jgi:hypothetical protein
VALGESLTGQKFESAKEIYNFARSTVATGSTDYLNFARCTIRKVSQLSESKLTPDMVKDVLQATASDAKW